VSTQKAFFGNAGYCDTAASFVDEALTLKLHISSKIEDTFAVLLGRWVIERTFA
jgi:hypothetical protein